MDRQRVSSAQKGNTAQPQQRRQHRRAATALLARVLGKEVFWCPTVAAISDTRVPMAVPVQCVLAELIKTSLDHRRALFARKESTRTYWAPRCVRIVPWETSMKALGRLSAIHVPMEHTPTALDKSHAALVRQENTIMQQDRPPVCVVLPGSFRPLRPERHVLTASLGDFRPVRASLLV